MDSKENNNIPNSRNTRHITSLNTFCLIKIFQYFDVLDLIRVSEVNSMFQEIINQHIIGQRLIDCLEISKYYDLIERVLQTFGASIRKLRISASHSPLSANDDIFEFIVRYCNKLRKLCLILSPIELIHSDNLQRAAPILNDLQSIEFHENYIYNYARVDNVRKNVNSILQLCPNLRHIKILSKIYQPLPQFRHLTTLEVQLFRGEEIDNLKKSLKRNKKNQTIEYLWL